MVLSAAFSGSNILFFGVLGEPYILICTNFYVWFMMVTNMIYFNMACVLTKHPAIGSGSYHQGPL